MTTYREVKKSDQEELFRLVCEFPTPIAISKQFFDDMFKNSISDTRSIIMVAESDDQLIGYISGYVHEAFYASGSVAWVDEVLVTEKHRGSSIGGKLMARFEKQAKEHNCVLVSLATTGAKGFYEHIGYVSKAGYYKKYL